MAQKSVCIDLFNKDSKSGMEWLVKNGHIENTPDSIAGFLHFTKNLDKAAIGNYIGETVPMAQAYASKFKIDLMDIDIALSYFLGSFHMPRDPKKIDNIIMGFSRNYYIQCICLGFNKGVFGGDESIYFLSYAIILLANDSNDPKVTKKLTKEQFMQSLQKSNGGKDFDKLLLSNIFDRVTNASKTQTK